MRTKVLEWTCPRCGRKLRSLYPAQLDFNSRAHLLTHSAPSLKREPQPRRGEGLKKGRRKR